MAQATPAVTRQPARRRTAVTLIAAGAILLSSCAPAHLEIDVTPADANLFLNGTPVTLDAVRAGARPGDVISAERTGYHPAREVVQAARVTSIALLPRTFLLTIRGVPEDAQLSVDGEAVGFASAPAATVTELSITFGPHSIEISRDVEVSGPTELTVKLLPEESRHEYLVTYQTGRQPKQVVFTPDGSRILVPLLGDDGMDIIDLATGRGRVGEPAATPAVCDDRG